MLNDAQIIGEQLEQHNRNVLIASAQEKLKTNKPLKEEEQVAIRTAIVEKHREADLIYMRAMPKQDFLDMFGGSEKVFRDWRRTLGMPWPEKRKPVDAIEMFAWFRKYLADNSRAVGSTTNERLKRAQAEKVEMDNARKRKQLVPIEDVRELFRIFCEAISKELTLAQKVCPEIVERITAAISNARDTIADRFGSPD